MRIRKSTFLDITKLASFVAFCLLLLLSVYFTGRLSILPSLHDPDSWWLFLWAFWCWFAVLVSSWIAYVLIRSHADRARDDDWRSESFAKPNVQLRLRVKGRVARR